MPNIKVISIIVVTALVSYVFWFFSKPWIQSASQFGDIGLWLLPFALLILLGSCLALSFMLLPQKRLKLAVSACVGITHVLVFGFHYLHLIAALLMVLFHVFAIRNIQLEMLDRIRIHIGVIVHRGVSWIILPIFIALSFAFFLTPALAKKAETASPDTPTIRQALGKSLDTLLADQKSDSEKNYLKQYAIDKAYANFAQYVGPYRAFLPPVFAFGLFLLLWGLGFIVYPLIIWVTMLLFWLMKQMDVVRVEEVDVKAERILL